MKRIAIATAVLLLVVVAGAVVVPRVWAQAPTVYVSQRFDVLANHDGVNTTSYELTISGPVAYYATLPVSALSGGVITFAVSGLSVTGNYTVIVTAIGDGGTANSDPFAFGVVSVPVAPSKPGSIRIVKR
jgi:hypothetical protein